jgi:hypothetical protein
MALVLPTAVEAKLTNTEVVCAAGDLTCVAREWSAADSDMDEMSASCWACDNTADNLDSKCVKGTTTDHVLQYEATATFKFKQKETKSTAVLKVTQVGYQPNSKLAVGRFFYRPSFSHKMYAGHSTIAMKFGDQNFGAKAVCRVFASLNGEPDLKTPYTGVNDCVISASTVTLGMGVDLSSPSFHVQITSMSAWAASATNKVSGDLANFKTNVLSADVADKQYTMAIVGTTAGLSNTPASDLTVVAARTLINVMDVGMVEFTVTSKNMDFGAGQTAIVSFPTYYNPCVGQMMRCELYDVTGKKPIEQLFCHMLWDHTM